MYLLLNLSLSYIIQYFILKLIDYKIKNFMILLISIIISLISFYTKGPYISFKLTTILSVLIISAITDIKEQNIYDYNTIIGIIASIIFLIIDYKSHGIISIKYNIELAILLLIPLTILYLFNSIGSGDIGIIVYISLFLGINILLILICSCLITIIIGISVLIIKKKYVKQIPFIPGVFLSTLLIIIFQPNFYTLIFKILPPSI